MHWQTKKILNDIISEAYKNDTEEMQKRYKYFTVELLVKSNNTYNGRYNPSKKVIEILNLNQSTEAIVKTCIHELAHHIDYCKNHKTGHKEAFYQEYRTLLYTALNMRILIPDRLFDVRTSQDHNKVKKIVEEWVPAYVEYKTDKQKVKVIIPFDNLTGRESLRLHGYYWNSIEKIWEKEIQSADVDVETKYIDTIGGRLQLQDATTMTVDAVGYIVTNGNSFDYKDILKENGFFCSNKKWYKKISAKEYNEQVAVMIAQTPNLRYKLTNVIR